LPGSIGGEERCSDGLQIFAGGVFFRAGGARGALGLTKRLLGGGEIASGVGHGLFPGSQEFEAFAALSEGVGEAGFGGRRKSEI